MSHCGKSNLLGVPDLCLGPGQKVPRRATGARQRSFHDGSKRYCLGTSYNAGKDPGRRRKAEADLGRFHCKEKSVRFHQRRWGGLEAFSRNHQKARRGGTASMLVMDSADAKKQLRLFKEAMDFVSANG